MLESGQLQDSMGKRCDFRNAVLVLTTSPTAAPLPAGLAGSVLAGGRPQQQSPLQHAGEQPDATLSASDAWQQGPTSVVLPEAHVHPEAYAGDAIGAAGGSTHSAHSAAAQCLQPEEAPRTARQPVHPLQHLPAELLSRLDAVVSMQPLGRADMERVLGLQLDEAQVALRRQGVELQVDAAARAWLAQRGHSPLSGAQRLQALLREHLLLPIAEAVLQRRLEEQQAAQQERTVVSGEAAAPASGSSPATVVAARLASGGTRLEIVVQ